MGVEIKMNLPQKEFDNEILQVAAFYSFVHIPEELIISEASSIS